MRNSIRDRRFPRCSTLGVLRRTSRRPGGVPYIIVSTEALYRAVGPQTYREYLPLMQHRSAAGPTPESCEGFLEAIGNG
jgi:hypothetical protein